MRTAALGRLSAAALEDCFVTNRLFLYWFELDTGYNFMKTLYNAL